MPTLNCDAYGHIDTPANENVLAAGAVGVVTAGTISGTTNAGAAPTVTSVSASDNYGSFVLTAVTGGGAQAAGAVATVTFAQSFRKAPKAVDVSVVDSTTATTPAAIAAYATSITSSGFSVTTPALTTAHAYTIVFRVYL